MQRILPLLISHMSIYQLAVINSIREEEVCGGLVPGSMCEGLRPTILVARSFTFIRSGLSYLE